MPDQPLHTSQPGHTFHLAPPPDFSLPAVVRSHGWVQMAPFEALPDGGLGYCLRLSSGKVIHFAVHQAASGLQGMINLPLNPDEQAELSQTLVWMLGMEQDFSEFYALAAQEPKLAKMVARQAGRVLRSPTLFEDVVRTLLTTNTLWRHTLKMCRELVHLYGESCSSEPDRRAFPAPQRLAEVDEATLRSEVRMGYRAPYVASLAQAIAAGTLDLEAYRTSSLSTPELRKELMRIKGVGGYAAANLLMLLGRYDYVPVDSWALKVVSKEFFGGELVTPRQVLSRFEHWGKWQGLVYWFWEWEYD